MIFNFPTNIARITNDNQLFIEMTGMQLADVGKTDITDELVLLTHALDDVLKTYREACALSVYANDDAALVEYMKENLTDPVRHLNKCIMKIKGAEVSEAFRMIVVGYATHTKEKLMALV